MIFTILQDLRYWAHKLWLPILIFMIIKQHCFVLFVVKGSFHPPSNNKNSCLLLIPFSHPTIIASPPIRLDLITNENDSLCKKLVWKTTPKKYSFVFIYFFSLALPSFIGCNFSPLIHFIWCISKEIYNFLWYHWFL